MPSKRAALQPSRSEVRYGIFGPYVVSPADEYIGDFEHLDWRVALVSVRVALDADPDNIEALLAKAARIKTDQAYRLETLTHAVKVGSRLWGPVAARYGEEMTWWYFPGTRPYMRAIMSLGEALEENGHVEAAGQCYQQFLAMCPNDPQVARFCLERIQGAMGQAPRFVA